MKEIVRKPDPVLGHVVEQETEGEMILAEAELLEFEASTLDDGDDPASWVPEFYMRKHAEMQDLESRIKSQYKRMMSAIKVSNSQTGTAIWWGYTVQANFKTPLASSNYIKSWM